MLWTTPGCKVHFTHELRKELNQQEIPLQSIQYYVSRKIKLQKIASNKEIVNDTAKLNQKREIVIDLVKIKRNTKGVVLRADELELNVAFEECDSCYLRFIANNRNGRHLYEVGALEWVNNVGQVEYDNQTYFIRPRNVFFRRASNDAALKVKSKYLYKFKLKRRKAKGMKVAGNF